MATEQQQAQQCASLWMNDVFRFQDHSIRVGRFFRITRMEIVWFLVVGVFVALVLLGFLSATGGGGVLFYVCSPMAIFIWSALAAWNGRKIAHLSPLRRSTGEGTSVWLKFYIATLTRRLGVMFNYPVIENPSLSSAGTSDGRIREVVAVEWIGTVRATRAPWITRIVMNPAGEVERVDTADVIFPPRGAQASYAYRNQTL